MTFHYYPKNKKKRATLKEPSSSSFSYSVRSSACAVLGFSSPCQVLNFFRPFFLSLYNNKRVSEGALNETKFLWRWSLIQIVAPSISFLIIFTILQFSNSDLGMILTSILLMGMVELIEFLFFFLSAIQVFSFCFMVY